MVCVRFIFGELCLSYILSYGILESISDNESPEGFHHIRDYVFSIGLGRVIHFSFTVIEVANFRRN